jgi:hypothetical protein
MRLFTLVLPRERLGSRCRFRTIRCHKVQNLYFRVFTYVQCWFKSNEVQDQKADVPKVRKLIGRRSKEPKVYVSLFRAIFRRRVLLPGDSFTFAVVLS